MWVAGLVNGRFVIFKRQKKATRQIEGTLARIALAGFIKCNIRYRYINSNTLNENKIDLVKIRFAECIRNT
jgi:hypothetical protein